MKQLLCIVLGITLIFTSCSSDDDNKSNAEYLIGTTWSGINDKIEISLHFTKENGAKLGSTKYYNWYDYFEKNGKIYLSPQKYGLYPFECSINNKTMIVINSDTGKVTYTLYRD